MTEDEAIVAFHEARKEYARYTNKYRAGKITKQERDFMRALLNATMRRFNRIAKEQREAARERFLQR